MSLRWGKTKIDDLSEELNAQIIDYMWGFVAVENRAMELEWGLPPIRHSGKDWYDLAEIRRRMKDEAQGSDRKAIGRKL